MNGKKSSIPLAIHILFDRIIARYQQKGIMKLLFSSIYHCLSKAFTLKGHSNRKEFLPFLPFFLFMVTFINLKLTVVLEHPKSTSTAFLIIFYSLISIYLFAALVSGCVRRMHDLNLSGKWLLTLFVPTVCLNTLNYINPNHGNGITSALVLCNNIITIVFFVLFCWKSKKINEPDAHNIDTAKTPA